MTTTASEAGFELVGQRRDGGRTWTKRAHPYLVYHLITHPNGVGELSWELALGEYFVSKGLTFSAQDELSLFVFPRTEIRGSMEDGSWLEAGLASVEEQLRGIDLAHGT